MEILEELLHAGMSVARFNFSHGTHEYHQETLDRLRQAMVNTGLMCAVMLDTKGPEIRTGFLENAEPVKFEAGKEVTITTDYETKGNAGLIAMSYKKLPRDVGPGSQILIADGSIVLVVISCDVEGGTVTCRCQNTATLGERKNVNLPGVNVDLPTMTEKDVKDIVGWGLPNDIDYIAASFVRKGSDIDNIQRVIKDVDPDANIQIISKIENQEGLINFDDILRKTDAVMVARGDLGMEIPTEKIFLAQKMMIQKCNSAGKPVVTATQMLESMVKNPRPTRAEATDVANAVLDGTDCVMLSGETAAGSFPVQAVQVMSKICREAEASLDYYALFKGIMKQASMPMAPLESLASSAVRTAHKVNAQLIVVLTRGGSTAVSDQGGELSVYMRPPKAVYAVAPEMPQKWPSQYGSLPHPLPSTLLQLKHTPSRIHSAPSSGHSSLTSVISTRSHDRSFEPCDHIYSGSLQSTGHPSRCLRWRFRCSRPIVSRGRAAARSPRGKRC